MLGETRYERSGHEGMFLFLNTGVSITLFILYKIGESRGSGTNGEREEGVREESRVPR